MAKLVYMAKDQMVSDVLTKNLGKSKHKTFMGVSRLLTLPPMVAQEECKTQREFAMSSIGDVRPLTFRPPRI